MGRRGVQLGKNPVFEPKRLAA
eukprot:COSAG03_NODE_27881_length_248_cov_1.724832_1_plen_21_part_01